MEIKIKMRCYRCNSVLSSNDFCNSCGADVAVYKKIVRLSNAYYNMGLAKAQIRDLTGACELLRRSVRLDKKNTNARNLLGLVYFEMGEAVQAFSEWIISKNFQPDKNIADDYIKRLQSNPVRLDTINQTIKKYNYALNYAKQGSDDLAVIQLKKVLNTNPNLIKGHLLLALLYMKKGDYERARKPIMKALKIDTNNPLAKKYLKEINMETDTKRIDIGKESKKDKIRDYDKEQTEKELRNGYDVIIPKRHNVYRESNSGMITVINVVIGLIIGVAMTFFLLVPAKEKTLKDNHNKEVLKLNSQIETLNNDKKELESKITSLEGEKTDLSGQLDSKGNENTQILADYDNLINAINYFNAKDYINCADSLQKITNNARSEIFTTLYNSIQPEVYNQAAANYYNNGRNELASANTLEAYDKAIEDLTKCFLYNFTSIDYVSAADKLGEAYEKQYTLALGQDVTAAAGYKERALKNLSSLINDTFAKTEGLDAKATENVQARIVAITDK